MRKNKLRLKELELENKILKEQLEKAFPVISLEKLDKWTYLRKKYGKLIWWMEFLIIFTIKDLSRYFFNYFKINPSDLLKKIIFFLLTNKYSKIMNINIDFTNLIINRHLIWELTKLILLVLTIKKVLELIWLALTELITLLITFLVKKEPTVIKEYHY